MRPGRGGKVQDPVGQELLGKGRVPDEGHGEDGDRDGLLHQPRQMLPPALAVGHRLDALAALAVRAGGGDVQCVYAPGLQHLAELQPRVGMVALGADILFQRNPDHHGKVRAAVGADALHDLLQNVGAVF